MLKLKGRGRFKFVCLTLFFCAGMGLIAPMAMEKFFINYAMPGTQTAWAASRHGILGQKAPELKLNTWIDENGHKISPIRLSDYRGKVVYLYFFQDW